jgi:hypothetical protein
VDFGALVAADAQPSELVEPCKRPLDQVTAEDVDDRLSGCPELSGADRQVAVFLEVIASRAASGAFEASRTAITKPCGVERY